METTLFDIIVIGAGSGGLNVASFMQRAGFRVLLIDKSDAHIGGDCLNFGCVPSKALLHAARLVDEGRGAERFGVSQKGEVDFSAVMEYVRSKQDLIRRHENADYFRKKGMTVVLGEAAFASKDEVEVAGRRFRGKRIVIATGSRPRALGIPGIEDANPLTNETVFSLRELPKRFVFVGGGPIGCELGQAFQMLGSSVVIVTRDSRILPKDDADLAEILRARMERQGASFRFGSSPVRVEGGGTLVVTNESGEEERIPFDALFVGIGRELSLEALRLERAGIEVERGRIALDDYLRTTNRRVYVCGDAAGQHQFTHAAELHAALILRNFFAPPLFKKKLNTDHMAWVTYTTPEIAAFGLGEAELSKRRLPYRVVARTFDEDDRAIVDETTEGAAKLFVSPKGEILGGTMAAYGAGELIQELILANTSGVKLGTLLRKTYPYPTAARINRALSADYESARLTARAASLLRHVYALFS